MRSIAAKEAKQRFGQLLDKARDEPVEITKHGRPVAVLLSAAEFEELQRLEDAVWAARAAALVSDEILSERESAALMRELAGEDADASMVSRRHRQRDADCDPGEDADASMVSRRGNGSKAAE